MRTLFKVIFVILGGIIGCTIGELLKGIEMLDWLSIGAELGFKNPLIIDISFMQVTFGFWSKINIAGILFLLLFIMLSNKVVKWIKI